MTTLPSSSRRRRKRGPRFTEIAAAAGVSEATVDRVLNERDTVAEATRRKVLEAAAKLGVPRILPDADHGLIHIDIFLPRNETPFFRRLSSALRDVSALLDRRVIVHRTVFPDEPGEGLARLLRSPRHRRAGFILAASETPETRAAMTEALGRGEVGVAVVAEWHDLPQLRYVGINNWQAGAAAGDLMGRITFRPGRVILMRGVSDFGAHRQRSAGFAAALSAFPHLTLDVIAADTRDEPDRCFHLLRGGLSPARGPVVGLYNTGAGSEGIARALSTHPDPQVNWIGHELSADHVDYLRSGLMDAAIDQDPEGQARAALQTVLQAAGVTDRAPSPPHGEVRIYTKYILPSS